jgi:glycosyltransferase involved in cell wall biosynthesis
MRNLDRKKLQVQMRLIKALIIMRMKILHVTQFLGIGGLERILFILIKEQMKAGHHVDLVVYDHEQTWVEHFRDNGIHVISDFRKKEGYDTKLLKWLNQISSHYDVIHTHDLNPLMYMSPIKVIRKLQGLPCPRLIHTAHGMDHVNKRKITKMYERLCGAITDVTVGVSPAIQVFYLEQLLIPAHKVININNGTSLDTSRHTKEDTRMKIRKDHGIENENPIWTYVARVVPLKNHHMILEAAREIKNINFLMVGPSGDEQYWNRLIKMKSENVFFIGARSNINEILSASDVYLSSSSHEGIPVTVLEAGAMKLPCLLSNIPGHSIMGNNAVYFDLSKIEDLILKIRNLNNSPDVARILATNLHKEVAQKFSSFTMSSKYLAVYRGEV